MIQECLNYSVHYKNTGTLGQVYNKQWEQLHIFNGWNQFLKCICVCFTSGAPATLSCSIPFLSFSSKAEY